MSELNSDSPPMYERDTPRHRRSVARQPIKRAPASAAPRKRRQRLVHQKDYPVCSACSGSGYEPVPDLSKTTLNQIAKASGLSRSLLSRMFSDDRKQKRPNPTLATMRLVCEAIRRKTGTRVTLDALAKAIETISTTTTTV